MRTIPIFLFILILIATTSCVRVEAHEDCFEEIEYIDLYTGRVYYEIEPCYY